MITQKPLTQELKSSIFITSHYNRITKTGYEVYLCFFHCLMRFIKKIEIGEVTIIIVYFLFWCEQAPIRITKIFFRLL